MAVDLDWENKEFRQFAYGSCQTLAVMNALLNEEKGRQHLKEMVQPVADGYVVTFPVRNPDYLSKIAQRDLDSGNITIQDGKISVHISSDADLRDIRLARDNVAVAVLERAAIELHQSIDGVADPFELMTGNRGLTYYVPLNAGASNALAEHLFREQQEGHSIMYLSSIGAGGDDTKKYEVQALDPNNPQRVIDMQLHHNHAYTAFVREDGLIAIENPHDTTKPILMTEQQVQENFSGLSSTALPGKIIDIPAHRIELVDAARAAQEMATAKFNGWESAGAWSAGDDYAPSDESRIAYAAAAREQRAANAELAHATSPDREAFSINRSLHALYADDPLKAESARELISRTDFVGDRGMDGELRTAIDALGRGETPAMRLDEVRAGFEDYLQTTQFRGASYDEKVAGRSSGTLGEAMAAGDVLDKDAQKAAVRLGLAEGGDTVEAAHVASVSVSDEMDGIVARLKAERQGEHNAGVGYEQSSFNSQEISKIRNLQELLPENMPKEQFAQFQKQLDGVIASMRDSKGGGISEASKVEVAAFRDMAAQHVPNVANSDDVSRALA